MTDAIYPLYFTAARNGDVGSEARLSNIGSRDDYDRPNMSVVTDVMYCYDTSYSETSNDINMRNIRQ